MGVAPVIIHFDGMFHEINHPAIGVLPIFWDNMSWGYINSGITIGMIVGDILWDWCNWYISHDDCTKMCLYGDNYGDYTMIWILYHQQIDHDGDSTIWFEWGLYNKRS